MQELKPRFWKADTAISSPSSDMSPSPTSRCPVQAPTAYASPDVHPQTAHEPECEPESVKTEISLPVPDFEMEKLSLERKAQAEPASLSDTLGQPSPELRPARLTSQSASPPPSIQPEPQHLDYAQQRGPSNLQSRKPKRMPELVTSLPASPGFASHLTINGDKAYATTISGEARPASARPWSPCFYPLSGPFDYARAQGLSQPTGPLSANVSVVSTGLSTSSMFSSAVLSVSPLLTRLGPFFCESVPVSIMRRDVRTGCVLAFMVSYCSRCSRPGVETDSHVHHG